MFYGNAEVIGVSDYYILDSEAFAYRNQALYHNDYNEWFVLVAKNFVAACSAMVCKVAGRFDTDLEGVPREMVVVL